MKHRQDKDFRGGGGPGKKRGAAPSGKSGGAAHSRLGINICGRWRG